MNNFPKFLFGTGVSSAKDIYTMEQAINSALEGGIVGFDTAPSYKSETLLSAILHKIFSKNDIKREDVFIQTKKLFSYGFFEQIIDIIPHFILSGVMMLGVWAVSFIPIVSVLLKLIIMTGCGAVIYLFESWIFKVESFNYILNTIKEFLSKPKG